MSAPLSFPDQQILTGLRNGDNRTFALLYTCCYPAVERLVIRNSGTLAHAQDIFQEAVLVLLEKVSTTDFELSSSLKTYLLAVSSNLWLKHLRQTGRMVRAELTELEYHLPAAESAAFSQEAETQQQAQLQRILAVISAKCKALIQALFFSRKTIQDFTQEHGYTSIHNAQNQKYKCLEQARRGTRDDSA